MLKDFAVGGARYKGGVFVAAASDLTGDGIVDFVVGRDQSIQILYGATALPTAVLIDRKGVIRYIESGTSSTRLVQMREMIVKLLAEK